MVYILNRKGKTGMKKVFAIVLCIVLCITVLVGCSEQAVTGSKADTSTTIKIANNLQENQPTPSDIDYSIERYNLIRRTYWVNGQREKANMLPCEVEKPLGYIVLFAGNTVVGKFVVDGKVSSLNSFLTPDSEYYEKRGTYSTVERSNNKWLADVDGSYGENDSGVFFFTPDGKYVEWTGTYLYSDIPFEVSDPVLSVKEGN